MARAPRFTNVRDLTERLNAIGPNTGREIAQALRRGGLRIENRAAEGIINPPKTGRLYPSKHHKGEMHQASAPGEFPAADSGRLHQSLTTVPTENGPDRYVVQTGANAPYATALELGTARIAPRPFMGPAFDETEDANRNDIRNAVIRGARRP